VRALKFLAVALCALLSIVGLGVMLVPLTMAEFGRWMQTPGGLYGVAALRIVMGASLVGAASASRMPKTLRVIGALIVLIGLITPLFGVERARLVLDWWVAQGTTFMRLCALFPVAFGIFLIHAIVGARASGGSPPRS
jgi:hypothetical protein